YNAHIDEYSFGNLQNHEPKGRALIDDVEDVGEHSNPAGGTNASERLVDSQINSVKGRHLARGSRLHEHGQKLGLWRQPADSPRPRPSALEPRHAAHVDATPHVHAVGP